MKILVSGLGLGLALALAGCQSSGPSQPAQPVASSPIPNVGFSPDVSNEAVQACQTLLSSQTDGGVEVVGSEFSQANSAVYMTVGPQKAPWRCLVSANGSNPSVQFMGSEGAL
jgi:hypothetical protein